MSSQFEPVLRGRAELFSLCVSKGSTPYLALDAAILQLLSLFERFLAWLLGPTFEPDPLFSEAASTGE